MNEALPQFVLLHDRSDADECGDIATLAQGIAASPIWERMNDACLVLREGSAPALAALGKFDEADRVRLRFLAGYLADEAAQVRAIDWPRVEEGVSRLAGDLYKAIGAEIRDFELLGLPRGGMIVGGLLAYALDHDQERCRHSSESSRGRPLLVVDDCALTGNRFARALAHHPDRPVVFAHLCSPAPLRKAILDEEPRVQAVIASIDLEDRTRARYGSEAEAWRSTLLERLGDRRYWVGSVDRPLFPWSEPDLNFWNPETGEEEWGWTPFAGGRRLRPEPRESGSGRVPVRKSLESRGDYGIPDRILGADSNGSIHLVDLESGRTLELAGVSAEMFRALLDGDDEVRITERISRAHDVSPERVRADLNRFMAEASGSGILVTPESGGTVSGRSGRRAVQRDSAEPT